MIFHGVKISCIDIIVAIAWVLTAVDLCLCPIEVL
jgi:hypothetical protein